MGVPLLSFFISSLVTIAGKGVKGSFCSVGVCGCDTREAELAGDLGDAGDMGNGGSASKSCPSKRLVDRMLDARELCAVV
jgi:hypothetical protein